MALICLCLLSACSALQRRPPLIDSPEALAEALRAAGLDLQQTAVLGTHFDVPNEILQVDSALVYIYEFAQRDQLATSWAELLARRGPLDDPPTSGHEMILAWSVQDLIVLSQSPPDHLARALETILGDPILTQAPLRDEPFPPAISTAIGYVAREFEIDPAEIIVIDYASTTWSDACLGYPLPGEICDPGPVLGWQIGLRWDDRQIEAHSDLLGDQVRLP
jgi:hypothetical protein